MINAALAKWWTFGPELSVALKWRIAWVNVRFRGFSTPHELDHKIVLG